MNKEFVPYDIALAMKELGFDNVDCIAVYYGSFTKEERDNEFGDSDGFILNSRSTQYYAQKGFKKGILAPLYQQAFRWFRKEYNEHKDIIRCGGRNNWKIGWYSKENFNTYQEAQDTCLRKLIEIVKEN